MNTRTRRMQLCTRAVAAIALASMAGAASAELIDARAKRVATPVPPVPAQAVAAPADAMPAPTVTTVTLSRGTLFGDFSNPGWSTAAPKTSAPVNLLTAISRLIPPKTPSVAVEGDDSLIDRDVVWPDAGLSRYEAMEVIAKSIGARFTLTDRVMRVEKAARVVNPTAPYDVTTADGNFRRLLKRWSAQAGFTFQDEHWALERDVPIVASASFGNDYKAAVRAFLESTEFTSMPGRACFYSNNVLRVVPRNEQCNRGQ